MENKVIESIENNYFDNFKPDITIEINNIFSLSEYSNIHDNQFDNLFAFYTGTCDSISGGISFVYFLVVDVHGGTYTILVFNHRCV